MPASSTARGMPWKWTTPAFVWRRPSLAGGGAPGSMGTTAVTTRLGLLSAPASPRTVLREGDGVALQPGHGVGECSSPCALAIEVQAALHGLQGAALNDPIDPVRPAAGIDVPGSIFVLPHGCAELFQQPAREYGRCIARGQGLFKLDLPALHLNASMSRLSTYSPTRSFMAAAASLDKEPSISLHADCSRAHQLSQLCQKKNIGITDLIGQFARRGPPAGRGPNPPALPGSASPRTRARGRGRSSRSAGLFLPAQRWWCRLSEW